MGKDDKEKGKEKEGEDGKDENKKPRILLKTTPSKTSTRIVLRTVNEKPVVGPYKPPKIALRTVKAKPVEIGKSTGNASFNPDPLYYYLDSKLRSPTGPLKQLPKEMVEEYHFSASYSSSLEDNDDDQEAEMCLPIRQPRQPPSLNQQPYYWNGKRKQIVQYSIDTLLRMRPDVSRTHLDPVWLFGVADIQQQRLPLSDTQKGALRDAVTVATASLRSTQAQAKSSPPPTIEQGQEAEDAVSADWETVSSPRRKRHSLQSVTTPPVSSKKYRPISVTSHKTTKETIVNKMRKHAWREGGQSNCSPTTIPPGSSKTAQSTMNQIDASIKLLSHEENLRYSLQGEKNSPVVDKGPLSYSEAARQSLPRKEKNVAVLYEAKWPSGGDFAAKIQAILDADQERKKKKNDLKSVKWDPAIVSCGPIASSQHKQTKITEEPQAPGAKLSPISSPTHGQARFDEESQISGIKNTKSTHDDTLRGIMKTWKKGDRLAIQRFLEVLKSLDTDDDSTKNSEKQQKQTELETGCKTVPSKGLNPRAPIFRHFSSIKGEKINAEGPELTIPGRQPSPAKRQKAVKSDSRESTGIKNHIPQARGTAQVPLLEKRPQQEPIWVNTFDLASPMVEASNRQLDMDFQQFCTMNNLVPILPASPPHLIVPVPPAKPLSLPCQAPTEDSFPNAGSSFIRSLEVTGGGQYAPDPFWSANGNIQFPEDSFPQINQGFPNGYLDAGFLLGNEEFGGFGQPLNLVGTGQSHDMSQCLHLPGGGVSSIGSHSTAGSADESRLATALEPIWAGQILDKFVEKYPLTGKAPAVIPSILRSELASVLEEQSTTGSLKQPEKQESIPATEARHELETQLSTQMWLLQQSNQRAPPPARMPPVSGRSVTSQWLELTPEKKGPSAAQPGENVKTKHAAEIQQRLEMQLLQQKEKKAKPRPRPVPGPMQRIHAAQIQQRLEMLLLEQKERKALERLSAQF